MDEIRADTTDAAADIVDDPLDDTQPGTEGAEVDAPPTEDTVVADTELAISIHPRRVEGRVELDGLRLHWRGWLGEAPPRAVVAIVHGLAEHCGRYGELVADLTRRGMACYGIDLRGHGRSDGKRVHVDHFDEYARDVAALLRVVSDRHPTLPRFLVGHSMGGLITLRYVLNRPQGLAGAVVSSPALGTHPSAEPGLIKSLAAKVLLRLAPRLTVPTGLDSSAISHDPAVVTAYQDDPLVSKAASAGWFHALGNAQRETMAQAGDLRLPVLLMQSGDDRLVDPAASHRFADAAPADVLTFREWPGFFHEMFHEPDKRQVFAVMAPWIEERIRAIDRERAEASADA